MKPIVKLLAFLLIAATLLPFIAACETPDNPGPGGNEIASISLDKTILSLPAGTAERLTATVLPETADQTVTWSCDNETSVTVSNGLVVTICPGEATVTATAANGMTASCTVAVTGPTDPLDTLDMSEAKEIKDFSGYMGVFRVKSSGELMFSPNLWELQEISQEYEKYTAYLRFTMLDKAGSGDYTFDTVEAPPVRSKGEWVDFYLMGEKNGCNFCPTAGVSYDVEIAVVEKESGKCVVHGVYENLMAPIDFKDSDYYNPTGKGEQSYWPQDVHFLYYAVSGSGHIDGDCAQLLKSGDLGTEVTAVPDEGFRFGIWSDGVTEPTRSNDTVERSDKTIYACFVSDEMQDMTVADVYITTDSGKPVTTKTYEGASVSVKGASDEKYNLSEVRAQIRGRGNSSFNGGAGQNNYDSKNSYRLKLDEETKFLGIGKGKNRDWVLNSNKFDVSGLRCSMVWSLARTMGTLPYVPNCAWVQLYVNKQYRGMYMVTELIETGKNRVDVDDEDGTNRDEVGFLIELDFRGQGGDEPWFDVPGYGPNPESDRYGAVEFCIKSDLSEHETIQRRQINAIKDYVIKCHEAIMSGNREKIEELVDLPSLVDYYIIEEWGKDCDCGRASFFIQRSTGGKLYFTAPWDFDFCFGTYGPATYTTGLVSHGTDCCTWHTELVKHKWFRELVLDRMEELTPAVNALMGELLVQGALLTAAADKNDELWHVYGNNYHQYVSSQASRDCESYADHIAFLQDWSKDRWQALQDELIYY